MDNLTLFNVLAGGASIASLIISLVAYSKVQNIKSSIKQKSGKKSTIAGRDINSNK